MFIKLKAAIKEILFGKIAHPVCSKPKPGWHTNYHGGYSTFSDWCEEFNVSRMHNRKQICLD